MSLIINKNPSSSHSPPKHTPNAPSSQERDRDKLRPLIIVSVFLCFLCSEFYRDNMDRQSNDQKEQEQEQINPTFSSSGSLLCSDETYEEHNDDESKHHYSCCNNNNNNNIVTETLFSGFAEQDLFCEDELELSALLSKEADQKMTRVFGQTREPDPFVPGARREAVEWILQAKAHHCFSSLTALLAVSYLDRFMLRFDGFQREQKPWLTQLTAVACLSLAAKVEEIHVPLLLDLQMEGTSKFMFEAKTIQRMEILVLSTLQWRMNPVTPHSFLHHISKRFGLKERICFEFLRRCELTLLSVVSDHRFNSHLPSAMAAATALCVVNSIVTPSVASEYEKRLLGILKIDKDNVEKCRQFVNESVCHGRSRSNKRNFGAPGSPNSVIDASFSSDGSVDSWATTSSASSFSTSSNSSSVTSSPEPSSKKSKNTTRRR